MLDRFDLPYPVNLHIRKLDILTNMVRDQIDFMSKGARALPGVDRR